MSATSLAGLGVSPEEATFVVNGHPSSTLSHVLHISLRVTDSSPLDHVACRSGLSLNKRNTWHLNSLGRTKRSIPCQDTPRVQEWTYCRSSREFCGLSLGWCHFIPASSTDRFDTYTSRPHQSVSAGLRTAPHPWFMVWV